MNENTSDSNLCNWNEFQRSMRDGFAPYLLSTIYVHDTLEGAKAIAEDIFGERATTPIIFQIYDRLVVEHFREEAHDNA